MRKIIKYLTGKEWCLILLAVGFVVCQVGLDLAIPDYMSKIMGVLQTPSPVMKDLYRYGGTMTGLAFLSLLASLLVAFCATKVATQFSAELRERLFSKVTSFSMADLNRFSVSSLITRSTNDVTQVQKILVMGLQVMVKAPIMAVWAITKIQSKNIKWTLATALTVVCLLVIVFSLVLACMPKFKKIQRLTDELNRVTRENLTGIRVVRAYNAEAYQEEKFANTNAQVTQTNLFTTRTMAFMMPTIQFAMNALMLAIYFLGAGLIGSAPGMKEKASLFSDMIVFSQYAVQVVMAFMMLVMIFVVLPRASVSAGRIEEVLKTQPSVTDGPFKEGLPGKDGEVEFRNVSFKYPDAKACVVHNISFKAKKGECVAFIGSTGSGKSTIVNMIPRFFDATEGEVIFDGRNVKDYEQKALRSRIAYVSQKSVLFSGSVKSNILFGAESVEENLESAALAAQAGDFIRDLEDGYAANVSQGGTNFSGGQKQRLSIARGLAKNPELIIFDDSFSALDYKTDRRLRRDLEKMYGNLTRILVSQRIGSIRDADRIIVLQDGEMVGTGTHGELLKTCPVYREIALSQLSKEEVFDGE